MRLLSRFVLCTIFMLTALHAKATPPQVVPLPTEEDCCENLAYHDDGSCKQLMHFKVVGEGQLAPFQLLETYENGQIQRQLQVAAHEGKLIANGVECTYYRNGSLQSFATYTGGMLEGRRVVYDMDGNLLEEGFFKAGLKEGDFSQYANGGKLKVSCHYKDDKLDGMVMEFDEHGNKIAMVPYVGGVIEGKKISWHPTGEVRTIEYFHEGLLQDTISEPALCEYTPQGALIRSCHLQKVVFHGGQREYHPNLREKAVVRFVNGLMEGAVTEYDANGKQLYKGTAAHGIRIGEHTRWYASGEIAFHAVYDQEGTSQGAVEYFYPSGQKEASYHEVKGKKEGLFLSFYPNGKAKMEHHYSDGLLSGSVREWHETGALSIDSHFAQGERDGLFQTFSPEGILLEQISYSQGVENGPCSTYYPNGALKEKIHFTMGQRDGIEETYYAKGQIAQQISWQTGLKEGPVSQWYENGGLRLTGSYHNDKEEGLFAEYNPEGQLVLESSFQSGKRHGRLQQRDPSGMITMYEATFENGLLQGEIRRYFENGKLAFQGMYKQGKPIGCHTSWHPAVDSKAEPQVAMMANFNEVGVKDGTQRLFHPNGQLGREVTFKNGLMHGERKDWNPAGKLIRSASFKDGIVHGTCTEIDSENKIHTLNFAHGKKEGVYSIHLETDGQKQILHDAFFVNDKMHGLVTEYDIHGKLIAQFNMKEGMKEGAGYYYQAGILTHTMFYHNDQPDGLLQEYFPNGKLKHEVSFKNGIKHGVEKVYFPDSSVQMEYNYKDGVYDGSAKAWNENGILIFEAEYVEGKRHGKFNKYRDDGTPRLAENFVDDQLDGWKISYDESGSMQKARYRKGTQIK